ncbi:hypothetical protein P7K49_034372 [Saguinus oedipus]|uniref:Uncharacterized protein n=1 Tax=Saguinus oedipus TaxID=9490 RepID=A0ABQ9TVD4_SAGOE|nr:hypothetical protein P7K49_034372 [Saguinus oedipus]
MAGRENSESKARADVQGIEQGHHVSSPVPLAHSAPGISPLGALVMRQHLGYQQHYITHCGPRARQTAKHMAAVIPEKQGQPGVAKSGQGSRVQEPPSAGWPWAECRRSRGVTPERSQHPTRVGDHAQVETKAQRREAVYLGSPSQEAVEALTAAGINRAAFYNLISTAKESAQLEGAQGEELEDPLRPAWILPCPPTEGGASAEVSVTQSWGDEIPATVAKKMACSLGSCRWRTPRLGDRVSPVEPLQPTLQRGGPA